jgi:hypothetical protein
MGFIAVLYYLICPHGKYHVSKGYNAASLLPHGPLDRSSHIFSARSVVCIIFSLEHPRLPLAPLPRFSQAVGYRLAGRP